MNGQEVVLLRKYAEGAYPQMKQDAGSDAVWTDMLSQYEYFGVMQALKNYIRTGNRFPPTLAELISGYEQVLSSFDADIVEMMAKDGVFDDDITKDPEIKAWNRANREQKTRTWLAHPLRELMWPDWLKDLYGEYQARIRERYFIAQNGAKRIGIAP